MEKFKTLHAVAVPMLRDNIDTDAILPVAYMKTIKSDFGKDLFHNLRYRPDGSENPDFILNQPAYRGSKIIVSHNNFGCGSSRETAVWALLGYGIRAVVAESFGDIFYNNSFRMGLLPITLPREQLHALGEAVEKASGGKATIVDLESQTITGPDDVTYTFEIDATRRKILLEGLDGVGL
ncbi:MAG: 3-isopropylmalate dehydratase small subunit, partial [Betaproteobacteria bacterium]|nr:3-isopropylmalate dehydratase small subunit [Betaproteobacteria bacterium]